MKEGKHVYRVTYEGNLVGNVLAHTEWEAVEIVLYSYDIRYEHNVDRSKFKVKKI